VRGRGPLGAAARGPRGGALDAREVVRHRPAADGAIFAAREGSRSGG
jgi:hypothetical protein